MDINLDISLVIRNDTEENWNSRNPVLLMGEKGCVTLGEHAGMSKTGNGVDNWSNLQWDKAVANGGNSDTIQNINLIRNGKIDPLYLPESGGIIVSAEQPEVSKTSMLWIDLSNNAIAKYSDGLDSNRFCMEIISLLNREQKNRGEFDNAIKYNIC